MRKHLAARAALAAALAGITLASTAPGGVTVANASTPKVPNAALGAPIVLDTSASNGSTFQDLDAVAAPDGTTWLSWVSEASDNGSGGDYVLRLCVLPTTASSCAHIFTYHNPLSVGDDTSLDDRDLHLSRTPDGTLHMTFSEFEHNGNNPLTLIRDMTSTDGGISFANPVTVGEFPYANSNVMTSATVSGGLVHTLFQTGNGTVYDAYPLDGSQLVQPPVTFTAPGGTYLDATQRMVLTRTGPVITLTHADAAGDVGYASYVGGVFNAQSSWTGLSLLPNTSSYQPALGTGPSGTFLLARASGGNGSRIYRRTAAGFQPIGPSLGILYSETVAEGLDGSLAALVGHSYGDDLTESVVSTPDLYHYSGLADLNQAGDHACSSCTRETTAAISLVGRGVEIYDTGQAVHAQRFGTPPLPTRTLAATGKPGTLRTTLLDGCVYSPSGTLHLALYAKTTKGNGKTKFTVGLDNKLQKSPTHIPGDYTLSVGKLKPGSSHTATLVVIPAKASKRKPLTLKIPFTMCQPLPAAS